MFRLGQTVKETRTRRETGTTVQKASALRVQKDVNELDVPSTITVNFPSPDDLMNMKLTLTPAEGYYARSTFNFSIRVPDDYPHKPPKVKCETKVYHPNIDLQGNVCLNILRQDWNPVLTLSAVLYGLQLLFLEPNPDDPLNKEAAALLKKDKFAFKHNVDISLRGGWVDGESFSRR